MSTELTVLPGLPEAAGTILTDDGVPGRVSRPAGVNVVLLGSHFVTSVSLARPRMNLVFSVRSASGTEIESPDIRHFHTLPAGWANGGRIDVLRPVNGAVEEIGTFDIVETRVCNMHIRPDNGMSAVGVSTAHVGTRSTYRPNSRVWWAVASIEGNRRSAFSAPVPFDQGDDPVEDASAAVKGDFVDAPRKDPREYTVDPDLPVPTGVTVTPTDDGNTCRVTWDEVPGRNCIVVFCDEPTFDTRCGITVDASVDHLRPDDIFILKKTFDARTPNETRVSDYVWEASGQSPIDQLGEFYYGSSEPDPGQYGVNFVEEDGREFIRTTIDPDGRNGWFVEKPSAGADQSFYDVNLPGVTYRITVVVRNIRSTPVAFSFDYDSMNDLDARSRTIPANSGWVTLTHDVRRDTFKSGGGVQYAHLRWDGDLDIDSVVIRQADLPLERMFPSELEDLDSANPGLVRFHAHCKSAPSGYRLQDFLQIANGSMARILHLIKREGHCRPWLQIPWYWTEEDYDGLAEYLCDPDVNDPVNKPWAYLRGQQGQVVPWQDALDDWVDPVTGRTEAIKWCFEVGNEGWQTGARPEFYRVPDSNGYSRGAVNGMLLDRLARRLEANPHFRLADADFYVGGWQVDPKGWTRDGIEASQYATCSGSAGYTGGWDAENGAVNDGQAEAYQVILDTHFLGRDWFNNTTIAEICDDNAIFARQYENGPGYSIPNANYDEVKAASQERAVKSVATGTSMMMGWMHAHSIGIVDHSYFFVASGNNWTSRTREDQGNGVVPAYQWMGLMNRYMIGATTRLSRILDRTELRDVHPRWGSVQEIDGMTRGYRVTAPTHTTYVLGNLSSVDSENILVRRKGDPSETVRRFTMTGDMQTHNTTTETKDDVSIVSEVVAVDGDIRTTLGPGMLQVFVVTPGDGGG
ncbi:hypothetical protein [Jannaschia sp. LMIT008]|uniref:hypothetical protein n=1 Tax=Jannaschia maritima TaxID=3032585 RepID=UPI00281163B0|nr:hypothetical protein [Jannaschia sp. LMIT008]